MQCLFIVTLYRYSKCEMNEMKNIEIEHLKEKIQTSTYEMGATGEQFN